MGERFQSLVIGQSLLRLAFIFDGRRCAPPRVILPQYFYDLFIIYNRHNNHHADRFALGTNRDERELTNGRLSCKIKFEEEAYYNAR